jgi:poly(3-hydroxybutyrate) depolymerase
MDGFRYAPRQALAAVVLWLMAHAAPSIAAEPLPGYDADLAQTSVSGISSGANMAVQLHVAYSSIVQGAGIIAGGPYHCARHSLWRATRNCMRPDPAHAVPDVARLRVETEALARAGGIDATAELQDSRIWLFSGKQDRVVEQPVVEALAHYYRLFVPAGNIAYENDVDAGHAMVTEDYGSACAYTGGQFINDCDYDAAGVLLAHIYGPLNPPSAAPSGTFVEFDQEELLPDGDAYAHSLSASGFAYVPERCASQRCRVHVALHGCLQHEDAVGDAFYRYAGYNRWADTNDIIVLYPQTIARYGWGWPFWTLSFIWNPNACWDWWGYDSTQYHTQRGPQMMAIRGMLERLAEPREGR